jgi:hypothetical protein
MTELDLGRLKTIANFLESQIGTGKGASADAGIVAINDEEARHVVEALREYVLRELALGNSSAAEWDQMRGFYLRHGTTPRRAPACLVCEQWRPATKIRPKELPRIVVCDLCRARALTENVDIKLDASGRCIKIIRCDDNGDPLSVMWSYAPTVKREEIIHEPGDA